MICHLESRVILKMIGAVALIFAGQAGATVLDIEDLHQPAAVDEKFEKTLHPESDPEVQRDYTTPLKLMPLAKYPRFDDDYDFRGMKLAIERQLKRYEKKNLTGKIKMGAKTYPLTQARKSLITFRTMVEEFLACKVREATTERCYNAFNTQVREKFDLFEPALTSGDPRFGEEKNAFFTGYHTMPIAGKMTPDAEYKHAIYRNPNDPALWKSRVEIDFLGALINRGLEVVYTKNLFDIYLLHVQGSGRVTLPDGSGFYLNYDGTNKQRWEWISKYMKEKGYIANGSIAAQRKFLRENPSKEREIYSTCPSYVFTRVSQQPPLGNDSVSVTDGRSIATDSGLYAFKGLLTFVKTNRPEENGNYDLELEDHLTVPMREFSRFFLDQDTGGAIKGKARADIYFGEDLYSQFSAMHMQQLGNIYYLMQK